MLAFRPRLFRLLGLLSAIAVTIPAAVFAQPGYLCRMSGKVSSSCCCAKKQAEERCQAVVEGRRCCEFIEAERGVAPTVASDISRLIAAPAVAIVVAPLPMASTTWMRVPNLVRISHSPGPPRFLVKCSFLI